MAEKHNGRRRRHKYGEKISARKIPQHGKRPIKADGNQLLLWGRHAVLAAIENSNRFVHRVFCTKYNQDTITTAIKQRALIRGHSKPQLEIISTQEITSLVPKDAVHQGITAIVGHTESIKLAEFLDKLGPKTRALVVVLDQVTDPHNIGAVIRSAAAFSADAVVVQDRHTPKPDGVLGKAASGAVERLPILRVTNLVRSIQTLKQNGFWCAGLTGEASKIITAAKFDKRVALILGAEGAGLRRLTRETCDELISLPTALEFSSLNISNAASIALYEVRRRELPIN